MLAKVRSDYYGSFGLFREDTKSNAIKTRESAPFEVDDALFYRMEKSGVLMRADGVEEKQQRAKTAIPEKQEPEAPTPSIEPEEFEDEAEDLETMSLKELREIAKECGVAYRVGMTKRDLINAIEKAEGIDPPVMVAAEPE